MHECFYKSWRFTLYYCSRSGDPYLLRMKHQLLQKHGLVVNRGVFITLLNPYDKVFCEN